MRTLIFLSFTVLLARSAQAQISAKLMRHMDVSDTQVVFVYGGDIWLVAASGGTAVQLTNSPGEESYPRFSPDGSEIAYSASYNGNVDVYVVPATGGVPDRVTYDSHADRMVDWHPDGQRLLFASTRASGSQRFSRFFLVDKTGGLPVMLNVPYGELASFSPDGNRIAYVTRLTEDRPFKRYRGGYSSDIYIYDLRDDSVVNITDGTAIDAKPAWIGDEIFFLSNRDENLRLNVWVYDTSDATTRQLTSFEDYDISYLGAGDDSLVFDADGGLYLMNVRDQVARPVAVNVVSDLAHEIPRRQDVSSQITNASAAPGGARIVFEARGELFNVPKKEGFSVNLTQSSGAFDRNPAWSPDGEQIAYWSDRDGEFEIYLQASDGAPAARRLTSRGGGFGYNLHWSPDGTRIAFIDHTYAINVVDVDSGRTAESGNAGFYGDQLGHGGLFSYPLSWSPDSRWLAYAQGKANGNSGITIFDTETEDSNEITTGFYADWQPVFGTGGKYLFLSTSRNLEPVYSDLDQTWVYPNSSQVAAISLLPGTPSLLAVKNDAIETDPPESSAENDDGDSESDDEKPSVIVEIDFDGIESRLVVLPPAPGNFGPLFALDGKLAYLRLPNRGSGEEEGSLAYYDFDDRAEETVMTGVDAVSFTADGEAFLVRSDDRYGIVSPEPEQEIEDSVPTDGLVMELHPRQEWEQIFADTWRRYRDFFYDPNMHGLNWDRLRSQYGALLQDARTRWDLERIQFHLLGEVSAGHTYIRVGQIEPVQRRETGFLGIDWSEDRGLYRVARIVRPAVWDSEIRSPLDAPGVDVQTDDYILAVNGALLDSGKAPYAAFEGLSGKTISLLVSRTGETGDAWELTIKALTENEENLLRNLEWIESNRHMVDELSGGRLGYVYMSNTAARGQSELVRMFYGQLHKDGFIIDERFNGGGQLADRFLELMQRPVVYNLHWRHARDHTQPLKTNTGPLGMLINGWAASGGDGLPWAFQELEAGPIVGENTMGILIGPTTGHQLVDGTAITVPDARLYDNDGHWFWEGEGVSPDIEVWDDPSALARGRDPQIERVVEEVLNLLENAPPRMTPVPPAEDRTARGLRRN